MLEDFPKEKLQEIYEILPEDLKEALFSQEIANIINDICAENSIDEKQISEVSKYVGHTLLGLLSPNEFEKTIKEKLIIKDDSAQKISYQITRLVFLPLKTTLEFIYKIKMVLPKEVVEEKLPIAEEVFKEEKLPSRRPKRDTYREPTE